MARCGLLGIWVVPVFLCLGCSQPKEETIAQAPRECPQTAANEPAAQTPEPANDILAVPSEPPRTSNAPVPPVTQAKPLPPSQYSQKPATAARVHVVQPKETLYSIARQYYSDDKQWRRIFQANRNRITDPDRVEVGMKLIIP